MPAAWCGIYGFNPSPKRVSRHLVMQFDRDIDIDAIKSNLTSVGPYATCVEDLVLTMQNVYGNFTQDVFVPPLKFDKEKFQNN
jgi:Asp-tRNA(Asn)/Glu-tRNA(Gln) amidotransferase A subunit family amidase